MSSIANILRIVNFAALRSRGASVPTTPPTPRNYRYLFSAPDAADKLFIHFNDDDRVSYR